ncbi:PREDICTED: glutamate receptor ionotropic, delta-2-like [Dinoponera quadriceps]|uniref:Glutamate receptor ionotropic, delta-2-like n=1 Tax=Dinoponera quadriceps TaxID=609295 RepID=A0A6P3Y9X3_DINQU|nr:PREDICTED: glutamate receptor ionotropic, delta-2-like [Dinoponera quadriceps]
MICVLLLAWILNSGNAFNDFPSLMSANASMAVVIDKGFFDSKHEYRTTVKTIHEFVTNVLREEIHSIDLDVRIFRNTKINNLRERDCPRFPDSEGVSIPLIPAGKELSQIFYDLRSHDILDWNNVNLLHDDTFDRDTISEVATAISTPLPNKKFNMVSRSLFVFKHADSQRNRKYYIKEMLEDFHVDQLGKYFLVIATIEAAFDVMEVPDSQWLYVITDSVVRNATNITSFTEFLSEGANVAFAYNSTDNDTHCDAKLMCHVQELVSALANALKLSLMIEIELYNHVSDEEFELIRLNKREKRREILKNIQIKLVDDTFASGGSCGKCLFWRFASAITWGNFFLHGKNIAHLIDSGTWIPSLGSNLTDAIFPHISYGFRGISMPVASYHNPPWQTISLNNAGEKEYGGLVFDVIKYLATKLNFTYTVLSPMSNRTLKFTQNETKSEVTYSFLTTKPGQLSRALLFTAPFAKETWACLAASIIIMGPILYLIHKYSPGTKTVGLNSSWQCVWYIYGALLQQGGMYLPRCDSARLLVGVWWLVVMVVVATYSGSLVAFLTFPNMDTAILTVDDLIAHKGKVTWGFPNGSFLGEYLKNAEDEKYHIIWERAEIHNATQAAEVIEKVKAGKHVLIDWRSTLRFLMRNDLLLNGGCSFSLSTDEFMDEPIAMIIGQKSPYTKIINAELHRMHESGLMNKWITEQIPVKDKCSDGSVNQGVDERKVNVSDMQGIFFVLFMGVAGSIFLLCCEFLWHGQQVKKRRKLQPFLS